MLGIVIALSPVKGLLNFEKGRNENEHGSYSMGADLFSIGSAHDHAGVGLLLRGTGAEKNVLDVLMEAERHTDRVRSCQRCLSRA